jgi:hypothetical protein
MDPKEYRKAFRAVMGLLRGIEKASGAVFPILTEFEKAYDAEYESTQALQLEVSELVSKFGQAKDTLRTIGKGNDLAGNMARLALEGLEGK